MGLFSKKDPCAICGGQVKGLFSSKIDGQYICTDCYGVVDLPNGVVNNMTVDDFRAYMAFREENRQLKQQFVVSDQVDFGVLDTKFMFDINKRLLCMDKHLDKTIFTGDQIKGFVIREDSAPIFEGSAEGLFRYNSSVPDRVFAMEPQINHYAMRQRMERMNNAKGRDGQSSGMHFDIPEPFDKFVIDIYFDHPYWNVFTADMTGPRWNNNNPNVNDFMRDYNNDVMTMDHLAQALMAIAYPNGPVAAAPAAETAPAANAAPEVDVVEQLTKFKELLDKGIITEEEFTAKKRQLLGI